MKLVIALVLGIALGSLYRCHVLEARPWNAAKRVLCQKPILCQALCQA